MAGSGKSQIQNIMESPKLNIYIYRHTHTNKGSCFKYIYTHTQTRLVVLNVKTAASIFK